MNQSLDNIPEIADKQKHRYAQGLGIDIAFFVLIALLYFATWYTYYKHPYLKNGQESNPMRDQIIINSLLSFCAAIDIYSIIKNSLGLSELAKLDKNIPNMRTMKSEVMKANTMFLFTGFFYDLIDRYLSEYSAPLEFHLKKKRGNLISLNIKYALFDVLLLATGIAWFTADYVYLKSVNKTIWCWETILGLVVMILVIIFTFGYLVPRQVFINKQIKLNDRKKISEEQYYDKYKFFYVEKVLTKFWNRDNK